MSTKAYLQILLCAAMLASWPLGLIGVAIALLPTVLLGFILWTEHADKNYLSSTDKDILQKSISSMVSVNAAEIQRVERLLKEISERLTIISNRSGGR